MLFSTLNEPVSPPMIHVLLVFAIFSLFCTILGDGGRQADEPVAGIPNHLRHHRQQSNILQHFREGAGSRYILNSTYIAYKWIDT